MPNECLCDVAREMHHPALQHHCRDYLADRHDCSSSPPKAEPKAGHSSLPKPGLDSRRES